MATPCDTPIFLSPTENGDSPSINSFPSKTRCSMQRQSSEDASRVACQSSKDTSRIPLQGYQNDENPENDKVAEYLKIVIGTVVKIKIADSHKV
jgi:hypothetical protein